MNLIDYLVLGVVVALVVCAIAFVAHKKKQGKSACGCCPCSTEHKGEHTGTVLLCCKESCVIK